MLFSALWFLLLQEGAERRSYLRVTAVGRLRFKKSPAEAIGQAGGLSLAVMCKAAEL